MSKKLRLTLEERVRAVEECINGKDSINGCSKKIGVGEETLRCWIRLYQVRGIEGLTPTTIVKPL